MVYRTQKGGNLDVSRLRDLLSGISEIKPAVKNGMHDLVDNGRFLHLAILASIADIFTDINLEDVGKAIACIDDLGVGDKAVLNKFLSGATPVVAEAVSSKAKKSSRGSKKGSSRSSEARAAAKSESEKIRKEVRKLHDRNPKQSNQEIQEKLAKREISASLQKINGFRAHFNGVGFHAKGKKAGRKKSGKK